MGVLNDIKNIPTINIEACTDKDIIKMFNEMYKKSKKVKCDNCIVVTSSEIEYIKKNFNKLSIESLNNIIESNKKGINKNNMSDFIMNNNNVSKVVEKLNRKPINKNSKYASAREGVSEN